MKRKYCHFLIRDTAKEMAGHYYEQSAKDPTFFKVHPNEKVFIKDNWGCFLTPARTALQMMLEQPDVPEGNKVQIRDALVKDGVLMGQFPVGIQPLLN